MRNLINNLQNLCDRTFKSYVKFRRSAAWSQKSQTIDIFKSMDSIGRLYERPLKSRQEPCRNPASIDVISRRNLKTEAMSRTSGAVTFLTTEGLTPPNRSLDSRHMGSKGKYRDTRRQGLVQIVDVTHVDVPVAAFPDVILVAKETVY